MRKYVFLFCFFPIVILAQSSELDSLQQALGINISNENLLGQTETLLAIGNHYSKQQQDSISLHYINKGLAVAPDKQSGLYAKLLYRKSMGLYFSGHDFQLALSCLDSASLLADKVSPPIERMYIYQKLGGLLNDNIDYAGAVEAFIKAEQIYLNNDIDDEASMLNIYAGIVGSARAANQFELSLTYARKGIEFGKNSTAYEFLGDLYFNHGLTLASFDMGEDAKDAYLKALELYEKIDHKWSTAYCQMNLGEYYNAEGNGDQGKALLEKSIQYFEEIEDEYSIAVVHHVLCQSYQLKGEYDAALNAINKSIYYIEEVENATPFTGGYYYKAQCYWNLAQYDSAYHYAQKELRFNNDQYYATNTYGLLSKIEKERGNYEQALLFSHKYIGLKDSLFDENLETKLAAEGVRLNVEKEQESREKAELKASLLQSQNQVFVAIMFGLLAVLGIGGFLLYKLQKARKLLKSQNQKLSELNTTKDKFFGIIAHDIRSPIVALDGVGEQMSYYLDKKDEPKLRRLSGRIDTTAKRLTDLLDNLLNWALLQTGTIPYHPVSLNLLEVADEVLMLFEPQAEAKTIRLVNEIQASTLVYADPSALSAIIRNLVSNAIKFTHTGGQVTLSIEEKEGKVFVKINDTGTGISAELLPKLFTLSKNNKKGTGGEKGTGLGLLLCKELVRLNKGNISVISEIGQGASFIFSLPKIG